MIRLVGWGLGIELHRATSSASANPQKSGGFVCSKPWEVNSVVGGQCIIQLKEKKQFEHNEHTALESTILEFWLRVARFYCYSSSWKWMRKMNEKFTSDPMEPVQWFDRSYKHISKQHNKPIPPGKDRWLATPKQHCCLSWFLTNLQLFGTGKCPLAHFGGVEGHGNNKDAARLLESMKRWGVVEMGRRFEKEPASLHLLQIWFFKKKIIPGKQSK